jgi:hypothetical protein
MNHSDSDTETIQVYTICLTVSCDPLSTAFKISQEYPQVLAYETRGPFEVHAKNYERKNS